MSRLDFFRAREIGDGAADFEDPAVGAGAQAQLVDGRFEQLLRVVVHGTITFDISGAHLRVGVDVSFLETLQLNRTRIIDPLANDLRRFAGVATSEILSKEFIEEIKIGKKILKSFRRILRRARITWIEGNHEFRLRKYLIKNAKELYGLPGLVGAGTLWSKGSKDRIRSVSLNGEQVHGQFYSCRQSLCGPLGHRRQ